MKNLTLRLCLAAIAAVAILSPHAVFAQKYLGGDISLLTKYEEKGAAYLDKDGQTISSVLTYLKGQGMNAMRVRLFVDPSQASATHQAEGVCQDLAYVKALGKRIKDAGLSFLLDFHYSDTWTDPGQHSTPASWTSSTDLSTTLYDYTKECLTQLVAYGATPDFIQVGNEVNTGMLWDLGKTWADKSDGNMTNFISYVKAGCKACREVCPQAKIVFHVASSYHANKQWANWDAKNWPAKLAEHKVDYDIIGLSYYPYHHGPLDYLDALLNYLETNTDKDIQIVEVGYPHAYYPTENNYDYQSVYPATEAGQNSFTSDLINQVLLNHKRVTGLYWWWPEANEHGIDWTNKVTDWYNMGLWDNQTGKAQAALYTLKDFNSTNIYYTDVNTDDGYFAFDLTDGKARIRKYNRCNSTGITIPESVTASGTSNSYTVTTIGAGYGICESEVEWMVLPSTATAISDYAFKDGCNNINITFNSVPTTVGTGIFTNVTYPQAGIGYYSLKSLANKLADYTNVSYKTWGVTLDQTWTNSDKMSQAWVTDDMTVNRSLHQGYWNTIMLPVALTNEQLKTAFGDDMQLARFAGVKNEALTFTSASAMEAYTPYLLKPSKEMGESFTLSGVELKAGDGTVMQTEGSYSFVGTLDGYNNKVPSGGYFLNSDKLYQSTGSSTLYGMAGYFTAPASARLVSLSFDDGTTAIIDVKAVGTESGQFFDLRGQKVDSPLRSGIYIRNGQKIVIKK